MSDESDTDLSRRTFMKGVGLAAGAATLGVTSTGTAGATSAADGFDPRFANWRVREARKVWQRGYTGNPERSIAITDSGVEHRHPDLGPWNGVEVKLDQEDGFTLVDPTGAGETERVDETTRSYSGTVLPGGPAPASNESYHEFDAPDNERVEASLSWQPANQRDPVLGSSVGQDLEFHLDKETDGGTWVRIATAATANNPEVLLESVEPGQHYRFAVETYAYAAPLGYDIEAVFFDEVVTSGSVEEIPLEQAHQAIFGDVDPESIDASTPKVVGWYDAGTRYGTYDQPLDAEGHGTHCSSIMAGTGRASRVDPENYQEDDSSVLLPTDVLRYEVDVDCDGGVFGAAYGDGIELFIEGPEGETIERGGINADHSLFDNTLIDHPAVHDEGTATYTVYVRPYVVEGASSPAGRVESVAVGALLPEDAAGAGSREGAPSLHAGLAPNSPIVCLQGLGTPTADFGEYADQFASTFNVRTVNMSWGYLGGAPIGGAGGVLDETPAAIKKIAQAGVVTCAAAGNTATPANGNGAPAVADEAISVVATDPVDGLTSYSSGGVGGVDEDETKVDVKPDVSAPGGAADGYPGGLYDLVRAAKNGDPDVPEDQQAPIRDYTLKAGTSMATPYVTGVTSLVAQAMEESAPESIRLPSPAELHAVDEDGNEVFGPGGRLAEALRLKSVILSTASQTALTAAPFHHPTHRPVYRHGERDPYEGYGRVNPDAAVDAVSRDWFEGSSYDETDTISAAHEGEVGLDVPEDSRAVAGYVEVPDGQLTVDLSFSHYSGGNKGMALENPHLDLFVYDAEQPGVNGEPNVVSSAMGPQGDASVDVDVSAARDDPTTDEDETETRTFYVVVKLVNVPGAVNTNDVQAHFDLNLTHEATGALPLPAFTAEGSRSDDGSVFTQGGTDKVEVTVESIAEGVDEVSVTDFVPDGWTVQPYGDAHGQTDVDGGVRVDLGTVTRDDLRSAAATKAYFVEATGSGQTTFGPAEATIVGDTSEFRTDSAEFGGTDDNTIVGVDQNAPAESASSSTTSTAEETTDSDGSGTLGTIRSSLGL